MSLNQINSRANLPGVPDPKSQPTILLVEDEDAVRRVMTILLTDIGCRVLAAADGEDALVLCQQHSDTVQLIVTDVILPGMSGFDLVEAVSQNYPQIKSICLSGQAPEMLEGIEEMEDGTVSGPCTFFIQKPFEPHDLLQAVRFLLDV